MNHEELETAQHLRDEFSNLHMTTEFTPKQKPNQLKRRALFTLPAIAAVAAGAIALTAYNPLVPTPAGWAAEPTSNSTLTQAEANELCADRALLTIPRQMLPETETEIVQWLESMEAIVDERGDKALAFYDIDKKDYSAACLLSQHDSEWQADFFATKSHAGIAHALWADIATLGNDEPVAFVAGWKNFDDRISVKFRDQLGATSTTDNYFAIWLPADSTCGPVQVLKDGGDVRITFLLKFGGADGISSDLGICD